MKIKLRFGNKGITIVEVIVALSILSIIMMAAIILSSNAILVSNSTVLKFKAYNQIADYIEVFQETKSEENFIELVNNIYDADINVNNDTINITYNNVLANIDINDDTIFIKTYNANKTDKLLYEYSYTKSSVED